MSDLYNRISSRIGDEKQEGITPLDIIELPRLQQQIMFLLLRDQRAAVDGVTLEDLRTRFNTAPELPDTLSELLKNGWLILLGEPPNLHYKINLRRKRGSTLNVDVWSNILDRLSSDPPSTKLWTFQI